MFEFNPLEVGNIPTVGFMEEEVEQQVDACCDYIYSRYGRYVPCQVISDAIDMFDIDYYFLPDWLKDKFDWFEVID